MSCETTCGPQKVDLLVMNTCNHMMGMVITQPGVSLCPSHYQVVANGCGTVGFQLQQMETMDFTECCNWHDACYATCGMQKSTCEKKFDQCLKKMCKTLQDSELRNQCQQNKAIYVMGVQVMGCQPYQDSQKEACVCVQSQEDVSTAYNARIQHLYETHGEEDLSTMTLEKTQQSLLEKYQGKEPTMLFRLLKKFPRAVNIEVPAEDANSFEHHEHDNEDRVSDGGDVEHIEL